MDEDKKSPISKELLIAAVGAAVGAIVGVIATLIVNKITGSPTAFRLPTFEEIPGLITKVYNYAPIPLRVAYYAWISVFILYSYADQFDYYHCNLQRSIKETNFRARSIFILAMLAVVNHFFLKEPTINRFPIYNDYSSTIITIGYFVLVIGFYLIYSARPVINGYWGPHIYEYINKADNKLIDNGIYKRIRHPIYLGQIFMSIATWLLSNSWIIVLFPLYVLITNNIRANKEEKHLQEIFKDEYTAYKKKVGKWLPRLHMID